MKNNVSTISSWRLAAAVAVMISLFVSCAKMGSPDGGWFDETPPHVIGAVPADKGVNVTSRTVNIYFDEYIKLENQNEKVVISPPQIEAPEIKSQGKRIQVKLVDSLKANTTYTIDFSDAISDNNEGNPLGNYTYCFSTGEEIDTMEVSGYVLEAENLEPIKGILVGLYEWGAPDSVFQNQEMLRVSRTDSRGHFVIKGIKEGQYRIYALQDMDNNYYYSQKGEKMAYSTEPVVTTCMEDIRQDTIWADTLHIRNIEQVHYTHFFPDDLVLRAFTVENTDRYLLKADRQEATHFTLVFSAGSDSLPKVRGLNFDEHDAFIVAPSLKQDTINYWLRDTALVNQDTLQVELTYLMTDSTGLLVSKTDTMEILSKEPYERRMKQKQKALDDWVKQKKKEMKSRRKALNDEGKEQQPSDSIPPMPEEKLEVTIGAKGDMAPDKNVPISCKTPLAVFDQSKIHLYSKHDTLWYDAPFEIRQNSFNSYELLGEWRPEKEYSLEIDSAAFVSIYGLASPATKNGFKISSLDAYATLLISLQGISGKKVVELLDRNDAVVKRVETDGETVEFFYVSPGTYYMRLFVDENADGKWTTGDYSTGLQPEPLYYYPGEIECKAKWDVSLDWNVTATPLNSQKPGAITKQKADQEKKKIKSRNAERARKLGLEYIPQVIR